jgi:phenylacetate-coenzyme A ligase PaaK-like adenylate-forming protein
MFLVTPKLGKLVSRFEFISVVKPLSDLVAELNEFQPNILHCYPTMLEVLAYEQNEGRLKINPWIVSSSSEPLTILARKVIQKAFPNSPVYENYGTTEGITIGSECHEHRGMHINSDNYIVETVRDDGSPTETEEAGDKVYLSCLFSRVMPLLRYELTDVTIRLEGPCPCGLPFDMIKVRGRTDDIFWVYDGQGNPVALPPIPFEAMLLDIQGMRQYQLVQQERNHLKVYFRPFDDVDPDWVENQIKTKFNTFLTDKGLADCVQGEVERVSEIERDPKSGKIRQIRSNVERLYLPGMALGERRTGEDRRSFARRTVEGERRSAPRTDDGRRAGDERRELDRRNGEELEQLNGQPSADQETPEES